MNISLEDLSVPALVIDPDGTVVEANAAAADRFPVGELMESVLQRTERSQPSVTVGERSFVLNVSEPFGPENCRIVLLTDVTQVAHARDGAERLAHARAEFLGKLSHEIRSAVASMIGFSEMLHDELSEANRELARIITLSGRHLIDTLNAVMDLARVEFRDEEIEMIDVDVAARIRERVMVLQSDAERKQLELAVHLEDEPIHATLNPTFLDRILHNLIDNAIKYTDAGRVEVAAERRDGKVWIYIADTGRGIDTSFIPRLFAPFERERRDHAETGSGLGLAVTRYLVELMGGRVYACSTPGAGSTFTVTFSAP